MVSTHDEHILRGFHAGDSPVLTPLHKLYVKLRYVSGVGRKKYIVSGQTVFRKTKKDQEREEHPLWIVPALFRAIQCINDGQNLSKVMALEPEQGRQVQRNNAEFYETQSQDRASYLMSFHVLKICIKRNLDYRKELYFTYSSSCNFTGR